MTYSAERLEELSRGYDLDGGGYSFENPSIPELAEASAVVWEDPSTEYVPWIHDGVDYDALDCPVYAFRPLGCYCSPEEWPETFESEGTLYRKVSEGWLHETDRDCWACDSSGTWEDEDTGERHSCGRCGDGEGILTSDGGVWALYAIDQDALELTLSDDGTLDTVIDVYDPESDLTWTSRYDSESRDEDGKVDWAFIRQCEDDERAERAEDV